MESVEETVTNYWERVELRPEQAEDVRERLLAALAGMRKHNEREVRRQRI